MLYSLVASSAAVIHISSHTICVTTQRGPFAKWHAGENNGLSFVISLSKNCILFQEEDKRRVAFEIEEEKNCKVCTGSCTSRETLAALLYAHMGLFVLLSYCLTELFSAKCSTAERKQAHIWL